VGPQRDRLDIAQGLYGPFKRPGQEGWKKEIVGKANSHPTLTTLG